MADFRGCGQCDELGSVYDLGEKEKTAQDLKALYRCLFRFFGPQHWWPGDTPLEIAVGALLTQNTSWTNASRAVEALKRRRLLSIPALERIPRKRLAALIRSSGYFNQKAARIKGFIRYVRRHYSGRMSLMRRRETGALRRELLSIFGIGPETADSILLYALNKPVFVVDAYTRRILARHSLIRLAASYEEIQSFLTAHLPADTALYNDYHAQIVALGKGFCRPKNPLCEKCPARRIGRLRLEAGATLMPYS